MTLLKLICALGTGVALASPQTAHHYFQKRPVLRTEPWNFDVPACHGKQQSPIAIVDAAVGSAAPPTLEFRYRPENITAVFNGHTIQHEGDPDSSLLVGNEVFTLEQFHLHSPAEHTLEGKTFAGELHYVHKSKAGKVLVVAVFLEPDANQPLRTPLLKDLPAVTGETVVVEAKLNPGNFLPKSREYFAYDGSFTTPPCTEGVRWVVMKEPLGVRPDMLARLSAILHGNNRPLQAINDRTVVKAGRN